MKKILIAALLLVSALSHAQSGGFKISAKVGELGKPSKAFLVYVENGQQRVDSAAVLAGGFTFSGTVAEPTRAQLILSREGKNYHALKGRGDALVVYLEQGMIKITASDSLAKAKISGSLLNEENRLLQEALKPANEKSAALYKVYGNATEENRKSAQFQREMDEKDKEIENERKKVQLEFIEKHPRSMLSLYQLKEYAGGIPEAGSTLDLFEGLNRAVKESPSGKAYKAYLTAMLKLDIGRPAPEFSQADTLGTMIALSSYRGKYVLVDFWASWCKPCRAENPNLVASYARFHPLGLEILGVSLDQPTGKAAWIKAIHDDHLLWAQVSDLKYWKNEVAVLYAVRAVPQNYLIDPSGKIVGKNLRGEQLNKRLAELLEKRSK